MGFGRVRNLMNWSSESRVVKGVVWGGVGMVMWFVFSLGCDGDLGLVGYVFLYCEFLVV